MMNFSGGYNGYNPYMTAQQRLAQMEAQYPQFAQAPALPQPAGFKTIPVANIDEANATQADMSGNPMFFYNKGQNEIYVKQLNLQSGLANFQTYKLAQAPSANENTSIGVNISEKQYKVLTDKLDALYSMLANKDIEQSKREVKGNAK